MRKKYSLVLLTIMTSFMSFGQNIRFSWTVSQLTSTSYRVSYQAHTTTGSETMTGVDMRWYYDASEVTVSNLDVSYLVTTQNWGVGNETSNNTAHSHSATVDGNAYTTRVTYGNFDQNFTGFSITTTPVTIITFDVSNATGTSGTGNNAAAAAAADVAGLQYSDAGFTGHDVQITGTQTQKMEVVTSTYTGSWDNDAAENLRTFDNAVVSSGTYTPGGNISVNDFTIAPNAIVNAGSNTLTTAGTFTVQASAAGYGQFIGPATSGVFQQYVGTQEAWRHLASPVSGDLSALDAGGANLNFNTGASTSNVYVFDPATFDWSAVTANTHNLNTAGQGVALYLGGSNFGTSGTITWTGTSNAGTRNISYSYTGDNYAGGNPPNEHNGWNMIANPYPCNVDFHNFDNSSVITTYHVFTPTGAGTGTYASYSEAGGGSPGQYIAPGQAIWVQGVQGNNGGSLNFTDADRTTSGGNVTKNNFKTNSTGKGIYDRIKLMVSNSRNEKDETVIIFPSNSTTGFDSKFDGFKPRNTDPHPNLFTLASNGRKMSINAYGPQSSATIVPVGFTSSRDGETYTISYETRDVDPNWGDIYLVDHLNGIIHNLTANGPYTFTHITAPANKPYSTNRFQIQFVSTNIGLSETASDDFNIYSTGNSVAISRNQPAGKLEVAMYNLAGQKVYENDFGNEKLVEFTPKLARAFYVVKARDANGVAQSETVIITGEDGKK